MVAPSGPAHPGCVGSHYHALGNGGVTRTYKARSPLYLHHAYTTASDGGDFFSMAQARNVNSSLSGRLQDSHPRAAEHLIPVDCQFHIAQLLDPLDWFHYEIAVRFHVTSRLAGLSKHFSQNTLCCARGRMAIFSSSMQINGLQQSSWHEKCDLDYKNGHHRPAPDPHRAWTG